MNKMSLEGSWDSWEPLGRLGSHLGASWSVSERLGSLMRPLGSVLGASWELLGASWEPLGASWERLGRLLGAFWGHLGSFWELKTDLESILEEIRQNLEKP